MTHGDDDGLRCPPQIAPQQIVIVPMLRDDDGDIAVLDYCKNLASELRQINAFGEPIRVLLDTKATKAQTKRWSWVKKGAPIILEIGPRDVADGKAAVIRRDRLYQESGKLATAFTPRDAFLSNAATLLEEIQDGLLDEAKARTNANIARNVTDLATHFKGNEDKLVGWVEVQWARPTGHALDQVVEQLKKLKLTIRNAPLDAQKADGACFFTGESAIERILIGRTY
jgi:prolyl-tRNA synthetase